MSREAQLREFVGWCQSRLTGDEKGEAQIFLDHLFRALGHVGGLKEAGATLEMRVAPDRSDSSGASGRMDGTLE